MREIPGKNTFGIAETAMPGPKEMVMGPERFVCWAAICCLFVLILPGCDDGSDGDSPGEDVLIPAVEYSDRSLLFVENPDSAVSLLEASETDQTAFGARDNELLLEASEIDQSRHHTVISDDDGRTLLLASDEVIVRFVRDDPEESGRLQVLDAQEVEIAVREDLLLDAEEAEVPDGRGTDDLIEALTATETDLQTGRWSALRREAVELLDATENVPSGLGDAVDAILLDAVETVQVLRAGVYLAAQEFAGRDVDAPNAYRVPEDDAFLTDVDIASLQTLEGREAFRGTVAGIAEELLLLAAEETVPGLFLPETLLLLNGETITVTATPGLELARFIATAGNHSCAISLSDMLYCWGSSSQGQLGLGSTLPELRPQQLSETVYTFVDLGERHSCAIGETAPGGDRSAFCWGDNRDGEAAGDEASDSLTTPDFIDLTGVRSLSAGGSHTCAVTEDGLLRCWGSNSDGQLGVPAIEGTTNIPTTVGGASDWEQVSAGALHTCAINTTGELFCWGFNTDGRAGLGDLLSADSPTQVGSDTWRAVSAGGAFSCGINTADELWCWGQNNFGQLGIGSTVGSAVPVQVGTGSWSQVSAGFLHACGIDTDDVLHCWGSNFSGRLGLGDETQRTSPTPVEPAEMWNMVATSNSHSCAIRSDDTIWCWGINDLGQLGTGGTLPTLIPEQVGE